MARKLLIAGKDRWRDYEHGTMQIEQALTYEIDTCRFQVRGEKPTEGEEVIIEDDNYGRLFAGIIVRVELARVMPDKSNCLWQVDCDDYTALLDRRLVAESYQNMSASEIFLDIVAKYCPGFTTNGVRSGAPVVESTGAEFEYKRPSECFRWLCDYVGWHWQPDYYKDLHFFSAEELANPAPMVLRPGGKFRFGKHSIDTQGLRNRVYVRGGTMLSDPQVVQWKADGVARIWTLPWPPHEVSLTVGEVPMTVGVENLHDEADFDYMMSFTEKYIRCSAQTATPVEGATMALTARQDIPVITMVEDYASQAAMAKAQGGDGIYEHVISDDTLISIAAAEAAGMADLREHGNPRVKGSFETEYVPPLPTENALNFDGVDDYVGIGTVTPFDIYTLEFWADVGDISNSNKADSPVCWNDLPSSQNEIVFGDIPGYCDNETITIHHKTEIAYNRTYIKDTFPSGRHHIAMTWNVTEGRYDILVDGEIKVVYASSHPNGGHAPLMRANNISLGRRSAGSGFFKGILKEIRFWSIPRTQQQIQENMYKELKGNEEGLMGYWKLNEGAGTTVYDSTPNGNHGIIYGTKWVDPLESYTWQPGQIVDIRLPDRGVEGEYLIQRVTITPTWPNPSIWTFRVDYGGRLLGIADFLKALVSAQQKKRVIEPTKNVQKYIYGEETLQISDELLTATRTLPFICGEPDAICGLVVVSNG